MKKALIAVLSLLPILALSLRCQVVSPTYRHLKTYTDTIAVPGSGLKDVSFYFTARDTIKSNMSVVGDNFFDWYVFRSYNFRNSPHDSLHSMYWGIQYQVGYADWYGFPADTFTFEFVNRAADPCTLHLTVKRTYWSDDSAGP
jgi:hypothetical protein